jgi:chromosome segregation ATPase
MGGYMEEKRETFEERMEYLNSVIADCERMREEWQLRIKEVDELKETYDTLINLLRKQLNDGDDT